MAVDYSLYDHNERKVDKQVDEDEDEYIDMEVTSFPHFFPLPTTTTTTTLSPPQNPREFEFQMSSNNVERESTTSPADELFYKGKLLPLHLPPRLQMVEKLLQHPTPLSHIDKLKEFYRTPMGTNTATTPTANTPFESCNISPAESCQVSRELNPEEYFREFANQDVIKSGFTTSDNPKKSWTKKLKTKIKSLFGKSGCSYKSSGLSSAVRNKEDFGSSLKGINEQLDKQIKGTKKNPFGQIPTMENEGNKGGKICHRRSFSGAFKRRSSSITTNHNLSTSSSSSSSSSSNGYSNSSNGLNEVSLLKRSSSANSEMETSLIQGAIAHCKQSQHAFRMRKTMSEIGVNSLSSARFAGFEDQTRSTGICRG